jgi:hypothetical protein
MRFGLARRFASVLVKAARGEQQADDAEVRKLAQRSRAAGAVAALAEAWLARG